MSNLKSNIFKAYFSDAAIVKKQEKFWHTGQSQVSLVQDLN